MLFEESNTLSINKVPDCFIYFLIDKDEVVYVGQTTQGIVRPFSHKDKEFDKVQILVCSKSELDFLEDKFIKKYTPKYNKCCNFNMNYSLARVKRMVQDKTGDVKFHLPKLRKLLDTYNITTFIDEFKGTECLSKEDVDKLIENLHELN